MGLFQTDQRITVFSNEEDDLSRFVSLVKAEGLNDAKISPVRPSDDEWQCTIRCKDAETLYYKQVLSLLYASAETQAFRVVVELDGKSEPARRCPREVMASFDLKSRYAFGDEADCTFLRKLRKNIVQGAYVTPATVSYYIVGGGSVTMSIPCLDPSGMEESLEGEFKSYGIKRFMVNIVDRERA